MAGVDSAARSCRLPGRFGPWSETTCTFRTSKFRFYARGRSLPAQSSRERTAHPARAESAFHSVSARLRRQQREREPLCGSGRCTELGLLPERWQLFSLYLAVISKKAAANSLRSERPRVFRDNSVAMGAKTREMETLELAGQREENTVPLKW